MIIDIREWETALGRGGDEYFKNTPELGRLSDKAAVQDVWWKNYFSLGD